MKVQVACLMAEQQTEVVATLERLEGVEVIVDNHRILTNTDVLIFIPCPCCAMRSMALFSDLICKESKTEVTDIPIIIINYAGPKERYNILGALDSDCSEDELREALEAAAKLRQRN